MKKTKIIATIGPASESKKIMKELILAGANVFRINFSHGEYENHEKVIKRAREVEKELKKKVGIIADVQGPRIRVASEEVIKVKKGEEVFLTDEKNIESHQFNKEVVFDWNNFFENLKIGKKVFIEDGLIQFEVKKRLKGGVMAEALVDGEIKPRKGVNIPSISDELGFLTDKDLEDLKFILNQDIDFIAVSFVSNGQNLRDLRNIIKNFNKSKKEIATPWLISKVEKTSAIKNLGEIIKESDGVMVARGDLAIEEPQEKVTLYQKKIILECLKNRKPVVVATQMLASMINNTRPTRAEISDVTNAVIDNADAVMLSNESAVGKFPVETVKTMSEIIVSTEESPFNDVALEKQSKWGKLFNQKKEAVKRERQMLTIEAKTIKEARAFSSLRQEDVEMSFLGKKADDKRKTTILWGMS